MWALDLIIFLMTSSSPNRETTRSVEPNRWLPCICSWICCRLLKCFPHNTHSVLKFRVRWMRICRDNCWGFSPAYSHNSHFNLDSWLFRWSGNLSKLPNICYNVLLRRCLGTLWADELSWTFICLFKFHSLWNCFLQSSHSKRSSECVVSCFRSFVDMSLNTWNISTLLFGELSVYDVTDYNSWWTFVHNLHKCSQPLTLTLNIIMLSTGISQFTIKTCCRRMSTSTISTITVLLKEHSTWKFYDLPLVFEYLDSSNG